MRNVHARSAVAAIGAASGPGLAALVAASCVQEPSLEELAAQSVVVTQVAPGTDFRAYATFAIGDTIEVNDEVFEGEVTSRPLDPAVATPTLEAVVAELSGLGYRRVERTEGPDLGVAVLGVVRRKTAVLYGAWWGYGAAASGYWGYGGSTFSAGVSAVGFLLWTRGALVIELYDLRAARDSAPLLAEAEPPDAGASAPIGVVWAAFIYGIASGLDASIQQPPIAGVRQAFEQSPYMRTP